MTPGHHMLLPALLKNSKYSESMQSVTIGRVIGWCDGPLALQKVRYFCAFDIMCCCTRRRLCDCTFDMCCIHPKWLKIASGVPFRALVGASVSSVTSHNKRHQIDCLHPLQGSLSWYGADRWRSVWAAWQPQQICQQILISRGDVMHIWPVCAVTPWTDFLTRVAVASEPCT